MRPCVYGGCPGSPNGRERTPQTDWRGRAGGGPPTPCPPGIKPSITSALLDDDTVYSPVKHCMVKIIVFSIVRT